MEEVHGVPESAADSRVAVELMRRRNEAERWTNTRAAPFRGASADDGDCYSRK